MVDKSALPFWDSQLPLGERVEDLLGRLTLAEKASQMLHESPALEHLGISAYNWWSEGLHGVARAGIATVFPQSIGLAAMFAPERLLEIASAISDEARAKHHEYARHEDRGLYKGLTFFTPNINIFRDPRWGRGHETYGECPFLTSRLAVAMCRGLQGDDPKYLKLVATAKHYAVHSGPEGLRHGFDAIVNVKDLRETYLPAFFACVNEARVASVMAAYNRTNGEPCSGSPTLLRAILREEWGFQGYVVSDCWAIRDFHQHHGVTATFAESAALAVRAGCDLNCGCSYQHIPDAVAQGLLLESEVDTALRRVLEARFRLGMFDAPESVPYAQLPYELNDSAAHRALALTAARESLVLLKNDGLLPLSANLGSIAVIGPNAYDARVLLGNYCGTPSSAVTPLDAIRAAVSPNTKVWYAPGCQLLGTATDGLARAGNLSEALSMAERADVVVLCLGLSAELEGEQGDAGNSEASGDKAHLNLTGLQQRLLEEITALGKPTVLVLLSGSALALNYAAEHVNAIVQAWYPGEEGGTAIADVLFGNVNPAGRLPITFPRALEHVPAFTDYAMKGRTYRFLEHEPLFPFGFGLSYTQFRYTELELSASELAPGETLSVSVKVENVGARTGDEVVQLYLSDLEASVRVPHRELRGFRRVRLEPGESQRVAFTLSNRDLSLIDDRGQRVLEPGRFYISVGGSQPDARSVALMKRAPLSIEFTLVGERQELPY